MEKKNNCRECGGICKPSKGIVNYHNIQHKLRPYTTLEFETVIENCLKCEDCGHSFIPQKKHNQCTQKN